LVVRAAGMAPGPDGPPAPLPQPLGHDLAAAVFRYVEPEKKSAGRTFVIVAVADDLVGEIELGRIELTIFPHMRLVAIGGDGDMLRRARHLRRRATQRLAAMAARNRPARVPLSTSTSLSGSTGRASL